MSDVHIDLLLRFDGESVGGRVRHDDGSVRSFAGWLGLLDAVERLRAGEAGDDAAQTQDTGEKDL